MSQWGSVAVRVEMMLKHGGMWTANDIAAYLGEDLVAVKKALQRMEHINVQRTAYIAAWTFEATGERMYPRAMYSYGNRPNARRPKPKTGAENQRNSRRLRRKRVASVWEWRG